MWNISLRTKISLSMALVGLLMVAAFVTVDYRLRQRELLVSFQQFVRTVAGTTALALSARDLDHVHSSDDAASPEYQRPLAVLKRSRLINRLQEQDLFIIRPLSGDCSKAEFVISIQSDDVIGQSYSVGDTNREAILKASRGSPATTGIYRDNYGTFISGYAPVQRENGELAAIVEADVDIDDYLARARHDLWIVAALSGCVFLVAMVPGLLLSRHVTRGLDNLSSGIRRFRAGDLSVQVKLRNPIGGADEMVHLGQAFDELIVSLAEKLAMLPYVSRLTADAVRKSRTDPSWLTGSEQEVVVLFADLRGFTSFSENRNAGQVVTELNQLLAVAADSVISCGGDVDKFVGDCIMAVFIKRLHSGGKDQGLSPEAAALKCAEQMIRHVDQEARSHGWALAMGVGIHCGPVVVGSIGSSARRDFTAIGHTVNLASRLCGKAAGGQVLISDTFHATLAPEAQALFVRSEPLLLKNVSQTVTAYGWYVQQPAAVIQ
jgi:class 3 adenylate cyclase